MSTVTCLGAHQHANTKSSEEYPENEKEYEFRKNKSISDLKYTSVSRK